MKILFINEHFSEGFISGAGIVAVNNYFMMKERGHECYFYAMDKKPLLAEQEINKIFPKSYYAPKNKFEAVLYRLNEIFNIPAKNNLEKVIEQIKPDIIHIHSLVEMSYSVILAIKKYKIPYIMTIHDAWFACPVLGTKEQCCKLCSDNLLNCIIKKCSRNNYLCSIYVMFRFWLWKKILKSYPPKKLIFPSNALKKYITSTKFADNIPVEVLPNTLDKDFENVKPNFENGEYFLFVGSLYDAKGVKVLLNAIKELPKDIQFHFAGNGTPEAESGYKNFVEENKLTNVSFLGKLNREELINEYQNCIAVIVPSICFDIFGMVNIEAFINGKPVIGSNFGGIPEIVENNITGIIVDPNNTEQLKNAVLQYYNDRNLVKLHGKNACNKAVKYYLRKNISSVFENICNNVISGRNDKCF